MQKIFKLFSENFWVRNVLLLITFAVLQQLIRPQYGWVNLSLAFLITLGAYAWFIFHNLILFEKCLFKKKYVSYFLGLIAGFAYYGIVISLMDEDAFTLPKILMGAQFAAFNTMYAALLYLAFKYFKEQQDFTRNKLYLFEMEQKYLRNQLSPHFLFNTLNNIYSYSLVESNKTSELILKLSELMRYLIQFNKKKEIFLKEEIEFIENYLAFEKERLEDRCEIMFDRNIPASEIKIEPLLFFPLIENAFKHGTDTMGNCFVKIDVLMKENILHVWIENKIVKHIKPSTHSGIENVRKRLQLFYPGKHDLKMTESDGNYLAELKIELHP